MSGPGTGFAGWRVLVAGAGVTGRAVVRVLADLGAQVTVAAPEVPDAWHAETLPAGVDLVVTSPGWPPTNPLLRAALAAGVPVWGDVELAWRLRPAGQRWLAVTGTNGKTTATEMLAEMLAADGRASAAAGNIGATLVEAVRREPAHDVLAVELSSAQLHWSASLEPDAAAVLNVAADHLDWHGTRTAYIAAKGKVFASPRTTALANATDRVALDLLARARGRRVRFDDGGDIRVDAGYLVDDAFGGGRLLPAGELAAPGAHNLSNALAAAGLARSVGVPPAAVALALRRYRPGRHRRELVASVEGVDYVDDSKATNPHAAVAALAGYPSVVWIAGGLGKGAQFDDLARAAAADPVRAAVLIGSCADELADSLARFAARLPVIRAESLHDAVHEAARLARPGDTVLLAPAAASMDMFRDYADRGEAFAAAVAELGGARG